MADGIDRDVFDDIMTEFKRRYGVSQKLDFSSQQMREIAFAYKERAREEGVVFVDDPFAQVVSCIFKVLASWDSSHARLYRQYIGVAEEWGTAVVVQRMVFGNLSRESGSGVTFTNNPLEPYSRQVRLFGDFAVSCQGEDLVGGLVFPLPDLRGAAAGQPHVPWGRALARAGLPGGVRAAAGRGARPRGPARVRPAGDRVHLRVAGRGGPVHPAEARRRAGADEGRPVLRHHVAQLRPAGGRGMGVAGGAYSGRAALNAEQIDRLLAEDPDANIVLLRPDTVPEDIAMIARVSGILTARGGTTSHAAVTAKRLGKTAVVECLDLEVLESSGTVRLAGNELHTGDWLSIDGRTGNIFLGRIPTVAQPALTEPGDTEEPGSGTPL